MYARTCESWTAGHIYKVTDQHPWHEVSTVSGRMQSLSTSSTMLSPVFVGSIISGMAVAFHLAIYATRTMAVTGLDAEAQLFVRSLIIAYFSVSILYRNDCCSLYSTISASPSCESMQTGPPIVPDSVHVESASIKHVSLTIAHFHIRYSAYPFKLSTPSLNAFESGRCRR